MEKEEVKKTLIPGKLSCCFLHQDLWGTVLGEGQDAKTQETVYSGTCTLCGGVPSMVVLGWGCGPSDTQPLGVP